MSAALHYLKHMGGMMLPALPIWLVLRGLMLLGKKQKISWGREVLLSMFVLYCWGLYSQTLLPASGQWHGLRDALTDASLRWKTGRAINLIPLDTIRRFWHRGTTGQKVINLAGNVAVFVPMGLLPPLLWRKMQNGGRAVLLCISASCFIECFQQLIGRSVDVDDVILNTLGGVLGWLFFCVVRAIQRKWMKNDTKSIKE